MRIASISQAHEHERTAGAQRRPRRRTNAAAPTADVDAQSTNVDWHAVYFSSLLTGPDRLGRLAMRRYAGTPDADAAYNYALDKISAHGWQRLRTKYRGRGRPERFLTATFTHLLEEYRRQKYGRKRPPAWLAKRGGSWLRIYRLSCVQRLPDETVADRICARSALSRDLVLRRIRRVRAGVRRCGEYTGEYLSPWPADDRAAAAAGDTASTLLEQADLERVLRVVADLLEPGNAAAGQPVQALTRRRRGDIERLRDDVHLDATQRHALRLVHRDGYSVAAAARVLAVHPRTLARQLQRTVQRLRRALEALGYDVESLLRSRCQ